MRKKVIVFGLGEAYWYYKSYIEYAFDIIGYSDSKKVNMNKYIAPERILEYDFDNIYITTDKYYEEIRNMLIGTYGIDQDRIIGRKSTWWYIDVAQTRHEWVKKQLEQVPEGRVILDAGAGEMQYKKYCHHLKYISQDFCQYDSVEKTGGLHPQTWDSSKVDIVSDIIDMPIDDNSIDVVLCTEVFEHIKNPVLALKEFGRIVKKDGEVILTAPVCSLTHMAPYYYGNGFSKYWYIDNLHDIGFEIEEIAVNGNYFDYLRHELMRLPRIIKKYEDSSSNRDGDVDSTILPILNLLQQVSAQSENSEELLCFGYFVRARKVVD